MSARKNRGGLSSKPKVAVTSDGCSLVRHIIEPTTKFIFATTMSSPKRPAAPIDRPVAKQRKCGVCGQLGHNRRKCPAAPAATAAPVVDGQVGDGNVATTVTEVAPPPPPVQPTEDQEFYIDWGSVLYVVFDLETTGRSRQRDEIIELAAVILDENGVEIEDASFSQFVKPRNPIPPFITELTSITNDDVSTAEDFPAVGDAFIRFIQQHADECDDDCPIDHIILVGHNAKVFDIPFLLHQMCEHGISKRFFDDDRFGYGIDTLQLARKGIRINNSGIGIPSAYNLPTLFQFVAGTLPPTSHRAMADVKATGVIFRFPTFYDIRHECVFKFSEREEEVRVHEAGLPVNDSESEDSGDSQGGGSVSSSLSSSSEDEDDNYDVPLGDTWDQGSDFKPMEPNPRERFEEHCTLSGRNQRQRIGLQCSPIDVNTPLRAWREIFKTTLLDKIVRYTNEYGLLHAKRWKDISRKDIRPEVSFWWFYCAL
jgi:DNA polymerase III epsilon subunit-like protein